MIDLRRCPAAADFAADRFKDHRCDTPPRPTTFVGETKLSANDIKGPEHSLKLMRHEGTGSCVGPPVGGAHVHPLLGFRLRPSAEYTTAREHESIWTVAIDDGEFEIAVEGRAGDGLPHNDLLAT